VIKREQTRIAFEVDQMKEQIKELKTLLEILVSVEK
jgi:hypothetical protein